MNIPKRLSDKFATNEALGAAVRIIVDKFLAWMGDNTKGLSFFLEYTDHGPRHISAVLDSAAALIREESLIFLKAEDAAVLVISTLLHDSAMHLTPDGFLQLLRPERAPIIEELDKESWSSLFDRYYSEARRWDDRTLYRVLGDQANALGEENLRPVVRHVKEMNNPEEWTPRYRKFLGEFIRRHHARLAHEIARSGYPGAGRNTLNLEGISEDLENLADIAGFAARSHNMNLRGTLDYLTIKYDDAITCRGSHPVYLGALLRIADFLELRSDRVNKNALEIQRLRSPISQNEWNSHLAVKEVKPDAKDKESVFVSAVPESAFQFIKLKSTLANLQAELDATWAVLGEVYSRQEGLDKFGLTLRRVRSNLDDTEEFVRKSKPKYFPIAARFETAGASLLKLLIRPLYGDSPEIGVRELLQNALDAVHELRRYRENHPETKFKTLALEADVLITVETQADGSFLTISDRGIGMSAEIVRDYFLKAGASYRDSQGWWSEFGVENKSKVLRSGRFGIGSLAAFLLGPRLEVWTRRVDIPEADGVYFAASIGDDQVEMLRVKRGEIGTIVKIKLSETAAKRLSRVKTDDPEDMDYIAGTTWDWYTLDDPAVERRVGAIKLKQQKFFPGPEPLNSDTDWREIKHSDYDIIHWNYFAERNFLVCNGIEVRGRPPRPASFSFWDRSIELPFYQPAVSVFDSNGNLPLTLRRDRLEGPKVSFGNQLLADVTRDFCAFLLVHAPSHPSQTPAFAKNDASRPDETDDEERQFAMPYFELSNLPVDPSNCFWLTKTGSGLWHPWHTRASGMRRLFGIIVRVQRTLDITKILDNLPGESATTVVVLSPENSLDVGALFPESLFRADDDLSDWFRPIAGRLILSSSAESREDFIRPREDVDIPWIPGDPGYWQRGEFDNGPDDLRKLISFVGEVEPQDLVAVVEYQFEPEKIVCPESAFTRIWSEIMKHPTVPFSMEERRKQFAGAFEELKEYVNVWELPKPPGWRGEMLAEIRARIARLNG